MASRPSAAPAARRSVSASSSDPDTKIGDFIRGKEIGKGSFATVYIASHKTKRSFAAVKAVEQKKLTRKLKENLESEIRILKSLQHPHIVALFSCIETNAHIYLIMEYCQLSDLAQFMKKRDQLATLPETRDIFRKYPNTPGFGLNEVLARHFLKQITSALEYLRLRNLIHRDIKPQNLLLNPSPAFMSRQRPEDVPLAASEHSLIPAVGVQTLPMLKIADFGFARHLPARSLAETLCGSPLYMAPEILSYKKYDAKADLWSVGTVTYEMLIGKPPFKAANHVDLLRKIDQAEDVIPFPKSFALSSDLKRLIESLLKRDPENRVEFENFFTSAPVVGPIPGLVDEDIIVDPDDDDSTSSFRRLRQIQTTERPSSRAIDHQDVGIRSPVADARAWSSADKSQARNDATRPTTDLQRRPSSGGRPAMQGHVTAPAREYLTLDQQTQHATPMVRQKSANAAPSSMKQVVPAEKQKPRGKADNDSTSQDLAFEKEYVMIEKRAVEVNAFADELAAAPHVSSRQSSSGGAGAMVRRATTAAAPSSSPSNAIQLSSGRRIDGQATRQPSYERRYAPSPSSATNMLSKALNMANARLYGMLGGSPPVGTGLSPPRGYGAYPSYPAPAVGLAITDGKGHAVPLDEDSKVLRTIEEAATRSDTVYSFAEVKFRQLLPATPSAADSSGPRPLGTADASLEMSGASAASDLTQVAVIAVSEEALVLFVKALAILAKSIQLAGSWWANQKRADNDYRAANPEVCKRMNNVVQWARNRFNECLEKSEMVGRRLVESQRKQPHSRTEEQNAKSAGSSGVGTLSEPIRLTSGVTAEKLMFERAVEMSRQAAINELIDEDIRGCEIAYRTAIMLMEAVLEGDDEPLLPRPSANKDKSVDEAVVGMESEDRKTVVALIDGTRLRLKALCKKIQAHQAAGRRLSTESSLQSHARQSPSPTAATCGTPPS